MTVVVPTIAALTADLLSQQGFPLASTAGAVVGISLSSLMRGRMQRASEILLKEVRSGHVHLRDAQIEDAVSITYRFFRAAQEGAGRRNLRLMARIIDGYQAAGALYADKFLREADIVATLSREEIIVLGTICRDMGPYASDPRSAGFAVQGIVGQLVPSVFPSGRELGATMSALFRTGYLTPEIQGGPLLCGIAPALEELDAAVRFGEYDFAGAES